MQLKPSVDSEEQMEQQSQLVKVKHTETGLVRSVQSISHFM